MKKIYTLIAASLFAFGANAQYDLAVEWNTLTEGSTVEGSPIDVTFNIVNAGMTTIPVGDTIWASFSRDGIAVFITDVNVAGEQFLPLTEDFEPGDALGPFGSGELGLPSGFSEEFCAVVYGVGAASIASMEGDEDTDNNTACVTLNVTEGFDVGIEEDLQAALGKVYVAGDQLMITNETVTSEEPANLNIINLNGQVVRTENFVIAQGTQAIEVGDLAPGIYVVSLEVEGAVVTKKISIQ